MITFTKHLKITTIKNEFFIIIAIVLQFVICPAHKNFIRNIVSLCFFLLLCAGQSAIAQDTGSPERNGNPGTITTYCCGKGKMFEGFDPGKEVISKRTLNSKHFRNDDGSYTAVISIDPIHYLNVKNEWCEIDSRITETNLPDGKAVNNSSYKFCNKANSFKNYFSANLKNNDGVKMEFNEGEVTDWLNPGFCWIDNNGNTISATNHNDVDGIIKENTISYASVFNGTDVKFTQKNDGKKMDIILANNSLLNSIPTNAKYLAFYETIQIPSGWKVVTNNNSMSNSENFNNNDTIRTIWLYDSKGKAIVEYTTPYFYDNDNNYLNKLLYGFYKTEQNKGELIIYTFVPVTWLTNPDREFPITIDPTTTYYPTAVVGWVQCEDFLGGAYYGYPFTGAGNCGSVQPGAVSFTNAAGYGINRSAFQFDISGLYSACGAAPTVTASTVKFYIWQENYSGTLGVSYYLANTATCGQIPNWGPITCSNVYNLCMTTGSAYVTGVAWPTNGWTAATELGATAHTDISAAASSGYYAIGCIGSSGDNVLQADYGANPLRGIDPPQLTVTYTCPCTAPAITVQPGNATICMGGSANFSVTASGTAPLSYQWKYLGVDVVNGTPAGATYTNATTATMTVSGITAAGSYQYTCYVSNACGNVTSNAGTLTVDPNVTAGTVSGTTPLCIGGTTTYATTGSGGSWSSTNTAVATVVAGTGVVTAVGAGTSDITYTVSSGCGSPVSAFQTLTVSPNVDAGTVSGTTPLCISDTATYTSSGTAGGSWSSTNTLVATVVAGTGVVTAVGAGTSDITYTVSSGCGSPVSAFQTVTVSTVISADTVSGTSPLCISDTATYTSSGTAGGSWSSTDTLVATVVAGTGVVTAVGAGTSDITYTVSSSCSSPVSAFQTLTISPNVDAGTVSGATPLCIGGTATYTTTGSGGSWSSTDTLVATVDAGTGVATAVVAGTTDITYTVNSGCGSPVSAFQTLTVDPDVDADTVSGTTPLCIGGTATYTNSGTPGGSWSSTNTAVATVVAGTGVVTAVSAGTSDITYTVSSGCGSPVSALQTLTVSPAYSISDPAVAICQGDSTSIYGIFQTADGTYYDSLTTANGCDSVHSTVLTVNPVFFVPASASICQGDSVLLPDGSYASSAGIYYDTLTTIAGCDSIIETTVTVSPNADAGTVSGTTPLCISGTATYTTTGSGGSWSSTNTAVATVDAGTGVVTAVSAGTSDITYTVSSGCGGPVSASVIVTVNPLPLIVATPDSSAIISGESVNLSASGGISYNWTPATGLDNPNNFNPVATPTETTLYYVSGSDANTCSNTDSVFISVSEEFVVGVSNIFSPNNDGQNDVLLISSKGVKSIQFIIYDRLGEKVFESNDVNTGWDGTYRGKEMDPGVFVYYLEVEFTNGDVATKQQGNITLIR